MVNPPAFQSSWQLFFLFSLQECGLDWCRWRPHCATYCLASRWRHAKTRLCLLFLTQNLSYCRRRGRFDCPSTEGSSEIIYTHIYKYMYIYLCVCVCAQYVLKFDTNTSNYLITPRDMPLLEMPVFCRQVVRCSVHYNSILPGYMKQANDFINKTSEITS
jgi:hypothetical protein